MPTISNTCISHAHCTHILINYYCNIKQTATQRVYFISIIGINEFLVNFALLTSRRNNRKMRNSMRRFIQKVFDEFRAIMGSLPGKKKIKLPARNTQYSLNNNHIIISLNILEDAARTNFNRAFNWGQEFYFENQSNI